MWTKDTRAKQPKRERENMAFDSRSSNTPRRSVASCTAQIIEFLGALLKHMDKPLLIVWDGAGSHRSRVLRAWLEAQQGRIAVAYLPPYAPELNPVEAIWAYLKKHELANLCPARLAEVSDFARRRLKSMQRRPKLIRSFWRQAALAL